MGSKYGQKSSRLPSPGQLPAACESHMSQRGFGDCVRISNSFSFPSSLVICLFYHVEGLGQKALISKADFSFPKQPFTYQVSQTKEKGLRQVAI